MRHRYHRPAPVWANGGTSDATEAAALDTVAAQRVRYDSDMKWTVPFGVPLAATFVISACAQQVSAQAVPLASVAGSMPVKGQYQPLKIDEVGAVALKEGRLVVRGSFESVTIDLPAFIDTAQVVRHWALVTESATETKRILNFTHDNSLDDFTIELPPTEAEIRYGVFVNRNGGQVLVLTWGTGARCFWGYLLIPNPPADDAPPRTPGS